LLDLAAPGGYTSLRQLRAARSDNRQGVVTVFRTVLAGALAAVVMGAGMTAQAEAVSPEDQSKLRKAGYGYMSWNMGKIKAQVIDQSVAYDQGQILAAARTLDAIANSGMGALYGPGTDRQVGAQQTRVKPEMFDNFPDVAQLSAGLAAATGKLVDAAAADDRAALRTAFAEVGQSCKACHDKYRQRCSIRPQGPIRGLTRPVPPLAVVPVSSCHWPATAQRQPAAEPVPAPVPPSTANECGVQSRSPPAPPSRESWNRSAACPAVDARSPPAHAGSAGYTAIARSGDADCSGSRRLTTKRPGSVGH